MPAPGRAPSRPGLTQRCPKPTKPPPRPIQAACSILRPTDRGPYVGERLIDVSRRAADVLGFQQGDTTGVHVRYLGPAPRRYIEGQGTEAPAAQTPPAPQAAQPRPSYAANASGDGAY